MAKSTSYNIHTFYNISIFFHIYEVNYTDYFFEQRGKYLEQWRYSGAGE
jgi:hypothetical protein